MASVFVTVDIQAREQRMIASEMEVGISLGNICIWPQPWNFDATQNQTCLTDQIFELALAKLNISLEADWLCSPIPHFLMQLSPSLLLLSCLLSSFSYFRPNSVLILIFLFISRSFTSFFTHFMTPLFLQHRIQGFVYQIRVKTADLVKSYRTDIPVFV